MRWMWLLPVALLSARAFAAEPSPAAQALIQAFEDRADRGEALATELGAMAARDQFLRFALIEGMQQAKTEADRKAFTDVAGQRLKAVDEANTTRLKEILETISWSELAALSKQAVDAARLIVTHSPDEAFQAAMLKEFEPLVKAGVLRASDYALLFDDVAMNEGRKQRYGSNFHCVDGEFVPQPLEDPARVDAWRAEIGLQPLAEYATRSRDLYGPCPND